VKQQLQQQVEFAVDGDGTYIDIDEANYSLHRAAY